MKIYKQDLKAINNSQFKDPLLSFLTDIILKQIDFSKKNRVLDLGCGVGRNCIPLAAKGFDIVAIDINKRALDVARKYAEKVRISSKIKWIEKDLFKIKWQSLGMFDICILSEVIEHVKDPEPLIRLAHSCLKRGGLLLLTTPNDPSQWTQLDDYAEHVKRFQLDEIEELLSRFRFVKIFTIGFPAMRLFIQSYSRLIKIIGISHKPREFRRSDFVKNLYFWFGTLLLKFDNLFNNIGLGTNIIAVAKR